MIVKQISRKSLAQNIPQYRFLSDKRLQELYAKTQANNPQSGALSLWLKKLWQQTKYSFVQGIRDFNTDRKWYCKVRKNPQTLNYLEMKRYHRVSVDLKKFSTYSFFLFVPGSTIVLAPYLWLFPRSIPTFFLYDSRRQKKEIKLSKKQTRARKQILEWSKRNRQGSYKQMDSNELVEVCRLLKIPYVTSVGIINKFSNILWYHIPYLFYKIFGTNKIPDYFEEYEQFKFDWWPFQPMKRKVLLFQVQKKLKQLRSQANAYLHQNHQQGIKKNWMQMMAKSEKFNDQKLLKIAKEGDYGFLEYGQSKGIQSSAEKSEQ